MIYLENNQIIKSLFRLSNEEKKIITQKYNQPKTIIVETALETDDFEVENADTVTQNFSVMTEQTKDDPFSKTIKEIDKQGNTSTNESVHPSSVVKRSHIGFIVALVSIICAMLVGAGIMAAILSNQHSPASGMDAISAVNAESVPYPSQNTVVNNDLSAHHNSYTYEDGFLTIKSDDYFISDYKEYMNLSELKKVKIEEGVTAIGSKAFDGCSNLSDIEIPDTVTSIGESAFEDCKGLLSLSLPTKLQSISGWAFSGCTGLKMIHIPANVQMIGPLAFSRCSSLESILVDNNNQYFSSEDGVLFDKDKTSLYKYPQAKTDASYVIPDSVQYIYDHAVCACSNIEQITIPNGVVSIGDRGFSSCQKLVSVNIPDSLKQIGVWAFSSCPEIRTITIPHTVTDMDHSVFNKWTEKQTIIMKGMTSVPDTWHTKWNANCMANIIWEE